MALNQQQIDTIVARQMEILGEIKQNGGNANIPSKEKLMEMTKPATTPFTFYTDMKLLNGEILHSICLTNPTEIEYHADGKDGPQIIITIFFGGALFGTSHQEAIAARDTSRPYTNCANFDLGAWSSNYFNFVNKTSTDLADYREHLIANYVLWSFEAGHPPEMKELARGVSLARQMS